VATEVNPPLDDALRSEAESDSTGALAAAPTTFDRQAVIAERFRRIAERLDHATTAASDEALAHLSVGSLSLASASRQLAPHGSRPSPATSSSSLLG